MSAILKLDFQNRKQLHFSEETYLNYTKTKTKTKKNQIILHVTFTFSLKQWETRTSNGPIWVPLSDAKKHTTCDACPLNIYNLLE